MFLHWNIEAMWLNGAIGEALPHLVRTGHKYPAPETPTVSLDGNTERQCALSA